MFQDIITFHNFYHATILNEQEMAAMFNLPFIDFLFHDISVQTS